MTTSVLASFSAPAARVRSLFATRSLTIRDAGGVRHVRLGGGAQAMMAGAGAFALLFSVYGVSQAATGVVGGSSGTPSVEQMRGEMLRMKADVAAMKIATHLRTQQFEQRQALIAAVLSGKGDPDKLVAEIPATAVKPAVATAVAAPFRDVEARQLQLAAQAHKAAQARLAMTASHLRRLGVSPDRYLRTVSGGMGGPFEAAPVGGEAGTTDAASDAQFRALFQTWKQLDTLEQTVISIPSMQPVNNMTLTSTFGVRTDPFRGVAAMHAGIDIPGPVGTPIYATADGIVGRAERAGGYGNLVELNHGKGIETRYGHLSKILVQPNTRVRRGQLIGLMGSTGRSTGSHLHYEVRVDGRAVNPTPYMQVADTMLSIQDRALKAQQVAVGGPADR